MLHNILQNVFDVLVSSRVYIFIGAIPLCMCQLQVLRKAIGYMYVDKLCCQLVFNYLKLYLKFLVMLLHILCNFKTTLKYSTIDFITRNSYTERQGYYNFY